MATEVFRLFGTIEIEDQEATQSLNSVNDSAATTGKGLMNLGSVATVAGAAIAAAAVAAGTAIVAVGVKSVQMADDVKKATNTLQTQTGATKEEMAELKDGMIDIYRNNFGESFEDIAESMAKVKQSANSMGLETNEQVTSMTQNAIMLHDTFGFEVEDSIKSVTAMVQSFGITSDEAMTLLAQGTQQGLNRTDDLLDTVNEYSPAFKSLGFEASDMFNALKAGAESGAFTIDKVGDAFKEFNIRVKDGSDASAEAFKTLGLNSDEMFKSFAAGGDDAKEAYVKVTDALRGIEDPLLKNQVGVQLFGTMFEDLEADAIDAMTGLDDSFNESADTLNQLNEIKYDSFGEAIDGIGRIIQTDLLLPIGEQLLPILSELAGWLSEKIPVAIEAAKTAFSIFIDGFKGVGDPEALIGDWTKWFYDLGEVVNEVFNTIKEYVNSFITFFAQFRGKIENYLTILSKNFEKYKTIATKTFEEIKAIILPIWEDIQKNTIPLVKDMIDAVLDLLIGLQKEVGRVLDDILIVWDVVWKSLSPIVTFILNNIKAIINAAVKIITNIIKFFTATIKGDWKAAFSAIWGIVKNIFGLLVDFIKNSLNLLLSNFGTNLEKIGKTVSNNFKSIVKKAKEFGSNFINMIVEGINAGIGKVKDAASNVASTIKDFLGFGSPTKAGPASESDKWIPNLINMLSDGFKDGVPEIAKATSEVSEAIVNKFKKVPEGVEKFFNEVRETIKTSYETMKKDAFSELNSLADATKSALKKRAEAQKKLEEERMKERIKLDKHYVERSKKNFEKEQELQEIAYKKGLSTETLRHHDKQVLAKEESLKHYELQLENSEKELDLIEETYQKAISEQELYNETSRLLQEENLEEQVALLEEYEPEWLDKGRTFAEKFVEGFNSGKGAIEKAINETMKSISKVSGVSLAQLVSTVAPTQANWQNTINQMKSNANKWFKATESEKANLAKANEALGTQLGLTKRSGQWYLPDGQKAFEVEVPALSKGGKVVDQGTIIVGEKGPEILEVPTGAKVEPLDNKKGNVINFNFNADMSNIDGIMTQVMLRLRQYGVITNG